MTEKQMIQHVKQFIQKYEDSPEKVTLKDIHKLYEVIKLLYVLLTKQIQN